MDMKIIDSIPAHTVEVGDVIFNRESVTVTDIEDHGAYVVIYGRDEQNERVLFGAPADAMLPLYGYTAVTV